MSVQPTQCLSATARAAVVGTATALALVVAGGEASRASAATPLDGNGMWIWYVSRSGGSAEAIAKKARKRHIDVVMIKSSDADNYWEQFSPELVDELQDSGLRVCAWQFVYGKDPRDEARRGADAVRNGADCLLIDAEGHYEGRHKAARRYIKKLRERIGKNYPLALASFPYVDFHPSFPYSVFLGPRGAQFNVPQMYWKAIGTSVSRVYRHTYKVNAPFGRPIFPLGQTWQDPGRRQITRFRRKARKFGADGVSWWSWQETRGKEWRWVGKRLKRKRNRARAASAPDPVAPAGYPTLRAGERGDLVVWAQQLLRAHDRSIAPDGVFDGEMAATVRGFQSGKGLRPTGAVDGATWRRLLTRKPDPVNWSRRPEPEGAASASVDALRFELPLTPGRP